MRGKKKLSVFLELTLVSLIISITILIIYTIIQLISLNFFSIDYQKDMLKNRYEEISFLISHTDLQTISATEKEDINRILEHKVEAIRIYSDEGVVFLSSAKVWDKIPLEYNNSMVIEGHIKFIDFHRYMILDAPVKGEPKTYYIQIVQNINIFNEFIESYFPTFIFAVLVGITLSIIGAIYVSKRFLHRLKILTTTMREIQEKGMNQRVPISETDDEFDKVNSVFNSMMDKLELAFEEQTQFVSDASHELRTPLTVLQGYLSMLNRWGKEDKDTLNKSINICLSEIERLKKLVNDLLRLSRADKNIVYNEEAIEVLEVNPIILNIVETYQMLNPKIAFSITMDETIKIKMHEEHLRQLLIILIDNAIKYNDKSAVKINISLKLKETHFYLSIKDNGIGIEVQEIPKLTNRFYKVDKSRFNTSKSFGLGLSIAKKIIENYQGEMNILSELEKGTEVIVTL